MNQQINAADRLIPKGATKIKTWLQYVPVVAIVLLYKGAEEMYLSTSKQYIYYWFKQSVARRNVTFNGVNISTSTNCPEDVNINTDAENEAQTNASYWELYLDIMKYSITLFTLPIYGSLSDYLGRKFIIILPIFGSFLQSSIAAVIIYFECDISYLLIAHASDGLLGTSLTQSVATYSFIADITQVRKSRTVGLALMECLKGIGKLSSSAGTGYFIKRYGYFYPSLTSAAVCLFASIVGILWFSETRQTQKECNISALSLYKNVTNFYTSKKDQDRSTFWLCIIVFVLITLPLSPRSGLVTLLQLGYPFCWPSVIIGWYGTAVTFANFVIGLCIIKPLLNCINHGTTGILAIISSIGFYILTALAKDSVMIFVAVAVGIPMMLPLSIVRGIASHKAGPEKQGALFAGLVEAEVMCNLVSTPIFNAIYSQSVSWMRGFAFIIMAATNVLALVFMIWLSCLYRADEEHANKVTAVNESRDD
ncbi:hypothetical protein CHS0354_002470 [Potamilus streckersoni]|uniref:Proton-coupled folate transporter n=1 Tax=Potamilus streckersoni TaxID=2493646 RepID=A0AAE0W8C1_9BIVA|nr:hypothetical protein CHS0354_002470 [Potamilus streckersoni]